MRRAELGTVRITAAVRCVAVVPTERRRVGSVAGSERRLAGRTVSVHGMDGRVGTWIGGLEAVLGRDGGD